MMTIPVLVSVLSNAHRDEVNEDETMTMLTSGEMDLTDTTAVIRYEESIDEGMPPQQVTITIEDESLSMTRGGAYQTQMVFRIGCRYEGMYRTPFGEMELAVYCTKLRYDLGDDGGEVELSYQLDLNGSFAAMHDLTLRLVRQNDDGSHR